MALSVEERLGGQVERGREKDDGRRVRAVRCPWSEPGLERAQDEELLRDAEMAQGVEASLIEGALHRGEVDAASVPPELGKELVTEELESDAFASAVERNSGLA